ncbi:hypothetical protein L7F22_045795 [Adiantum nelumboides]|nr:hypothetical protein [Adiantum nelumboides]
MCAPSGESATAASRSSPQGRTPAVSCRFVASVSSMATRSSTPRISAANARRRWTTASGSPEAGPSGAASVGSREYRPGRGSEPGARRRRTARARATRRRAACPAAAAGDRPRCSGRAAPSRRRGRWVVVDEPLGHHPLGLDERAQDPVRAQEAALRQQLAGAGEVAVVLAPLGVDEGRAARARPEAPVQGLAAGEVADLEDRELEDRAVDEVVGRGVAVERGDDVVARLDREHRLGALGVGVTTFSRRSDSSASATPPLRPVADAEQRQRGQRDRRHRGDPVDPHEDLERGLLPREASRGVVGLRGLGAARGAVEAGSPAADSDSRSESGWPKLTCTPPTGRRCARAYPASQRSPSASSRRPSARRPSGALPAAGRARSRPGPGRRRWSAGPPPRWRRRRAGRTWGAQLAGARPAALHVPLEVEALGHEPGEVLADHRLVDGVVAEAAADEDDAAAPGERLEAGDAQVVAAEDVVAREVVGPQHVGEHERVGVRAVRGQEDQGVLGVQRPQRFEAGGVGVDLPRPLVHRAQDAGEQLDRARVERGDQALQVSGGLGDLVGLAVELGGQAADLAVEVARADDLPGDLAGHLEPVAQQRALGAVEGEGGLAGHEGHEVGLVGDGALDDAVPAHELAQRRGGRPTTTRYCGDLAALRGGERPQRPPAGQRGSRPGRPCARARGRGSTRPGPARAGVVAAGEPAGELLAAGGTASTGRPSPWRDGAASATAVDHAALDGAGRVDEDHQRTVARVGEQGLHVVRTHCGHLPPSRPRGLTSPRPYRATTGPRVITRTSGTACSPTCTGRHPCACRVRGHAGRTRRERDHHASVQVSEPGGPLELVERELPEAGHGCPGPCAGLRRVPQRHVRQGRGDGGRDAVPHRAGPRDRRVGRRRRRGRARLVDRR